MVRVGFSMKPYDDAYGRKPRINSFSPQGSDLELLPERLTYVPFDIIRKKNNRTSNVD